MNFVLKTGLALRHGSRTLELTRVLSRSEVILEDVLTKQPQVLKVSDLLKRILSKKYEVIGSGMAYASAGAPSETQGAVVPIKAHEVDMSSWPKAWLDQLDYRLGYVKGLQAAHVSRGQRARVLSVIDAVAKRINDAKPPSASTVMEWARRYQVSDCNPLALLAGTKLAKRPKRLAEPVEEAIRHVLRTQYLTKARHTLQHTMHHLRRDLKALVEAKTISAEDAQVSRATLQRRLGDIDAYARIAAREGEARARMACRTPISGAAAGYPLQRVEIDHTPLDWVVICDRTGLPLGRPMLTVAIDAYSGYLLGLYLSFYGPGLSSVAGVIRNAISVKDDLTAPFKLTNPWLAYGIADEYVLDNGLEFHANAFKQTCWMLRTDITYCRVRTPWLKPHVERFFGGLQFLTLAKGRVRKTVANALKMDPYKDACVTFSDLVRGLTMFAVDVHPFQINQRKLARPFDLFQEGLERCPPVAFTDDLDALRLISGLSKKLTLNQGGVTLQGLPYGGPALRDLRNRLGRSTKTLCKWDPNDIARLHVQDPEDPTLWHPTECLWRNYANGLSWNQHLLIRKFLRADLRAKEAEETLMQAHLRLHDLWMDASRPGRRADSVLAARASGITSAHVFDQKQPGAPNVVPTTAAEIVHTMEEVSELDTFDME